MVWTLLIFGLARIRYYCVMEKQEPSKCFLCSYWILDLINGLLEEYKYCWLKLIISKSAIPNLKHFTIGYSIVLEGAICVRLSWTNQTLCFDSWWLATDIRSGFELFYVAFGRNLMSYLKSIVKYGYIIIFYAYIEDSKSMWVKLYYGILFSPFDELAYTYLNFFCTDFILDFDYR